MRINGRTIYSRSIRRLLATGQKIELLSSQSWGEWYYSADRGETWHKSRRQAVEAALTAGTLAIEQEAS